MPKPYQKRYNHNYYIFLTLKQFTGIKNRYQGELNLFCLEQMADAGLDVSRWKFKELLHNGEGCVLSYERTM